MQKEKKPQTPLNLQWTRPIDQRSLQVPYNRPNQPVSNTPSQAHTPRPNRIYPPGSYPSGSYPPGSYPRQVQQPRPSQPHYRPVRRKQSSLSNVDMALVVVLGGIALLILGLFFLFGLYTFFTITDRIMPGVQVNDISLSWMPVSDAAELLDNEMNHSQLLYITAGQQVWMDSPAEFGMWVDAAATAEQAYQVGRGADGLSEFFSLLFSFSWNVKPEVRLEKTTAQAKLALYADLVAVSPRDAGLVYQDGDWTSIPGEYGVALDIPATISDLENSTALIYSSTYLALTLKPVAPNFEDFSGSLESIKPLLNQPMYLRAYDPILDENFTWTVQPQEFANWVFIQNLEGDPDPVIGQDAFADYLSIWQQQLAGGRIVQAPEDTSELKAAWESGEVYPLSIWHLPTTYHVQAGDMLTSVAYKVEMPYWKIIEANPGIDSENLYVDTDLIIPSKNEMLPLPVVLDKRIVISIPSQHMWVYENGQVNREFVISTGIDDSPTMPGVYQVQSHEINAYASVWDLYMPHFLGIYEGWPGFMNGIHGLPMLSSGVRLWGSVLGRKASYGCIILDLDAAEWLYNWAEDGVVVEIQG